MELIFGIYFVQLVLERTIAASVGDRFVVRDTSSSRTVGGGVLIYLRAPERRRRLFWHSVVIALGVSCVILVTSA